MYVQDACAGGSHWGGGPRVYNATYFKHGLKLQNMKPLKPNKTTGSAENIWYPVFLSMEPFGGRPLTPADHVVPNRL